MLNLGHRLLLSLNPETAHQLAVFFLRLWQALLKVRGKKIAGTFSIKISTMPQLVFPTRLGLAAGFDKNAEVFAALSFLGFGFVEVGTVTPEPQPGNEPPRLFRVGSRGLINRMGFNNHGCAIFLENILRYRAMAKGVPLFANIGKNKVTSLEQAPKDYATLFYTLKDHVDGFVVNVSSPNTPGLRDLQNETFLEKIAEMTPSQTPTFVKLSPELPDGIFRSLLEMVDRTTKFTGVVLTNTSAKLAHETFGKDGGYSGDLLFERSLECVSKAREILSDHKSIIGVGGVNSALRATQMRKAGADLVEIYTAFVYGGVPMVRELAAALR